MKKEEFYNCTFFSKRDNDYITVISGSNVKVYHGYRSILEFQIENVSGAVYIEKGLYYTLFNDNCIYFNKNDYQSKMMIEHYTEVKLLKYINNTLDWLALQVDNERFIVYDFIQSRELFKLPLQDEFKDLVIVDNQYGIMIGCDIRDVSVYEGDLDTEYILLCIFKYDIDKRDTCILDTFSMFQDGSFEYGQQEIPGKNMKVPLYTGKETTEKSISSNGKYFVYYSDKSKRVVISKVENGEIFRIFILPISISPNAELYFNDYTNIVIIFDDGNIQQYFIDQSDDLIEKLNNKREEFSNIENEVYKIMYSAQCINLKEKHKYDVALSFAGEDRQYVEKIANNLRDKGIRVFYDKYETVNLWGKDLYQYLSHIYRDMAKYCVIFISEYYKEKLWTKHELRNAQNRAFLENKEYILPIFLNHVEIEGLNTTMGYIDVDEFSTDQIVEFIAEKVKGA